jgi:hypothetical protein
MKPSAEDGESDTTRALRAGNLWTINLVKRNLLRLILASGRPPLTHVADGGDPCFQIRPSATMLDIDRRPRSA